MSFIRCLQILFVFLLVRNIGIAQEMPVKEIELIVVESNRKFFSDDQTKRTFELNLLEGNSYQHIGYALEENAPVLIRNYGASGSLSSVSMRGTGTNHVQVSWNGIPLNSPTTGQADLSLVPVSFVQNVEVINGASGTLFGSGTFGGSINLNNAPDWKNKISAHYTLNAGSFGYLGNLLALRAGNQRFQYHLSVSTARAQNNFSYNDHYRYEDPLVTNRHNAYKDIGIIQNLFMKWDHGHHLEGGVWMQYKYLEIPALMGSTDLSLASQKDSLFRSYISYRKSGTQYTFSIRSAYFSDYLKYTDKLNASDTNYLVNSKIQTSRYINDADFRFYITKNTIIGAGLSWNRINGKSNNYGGNISENEYAVFGNIKWIFKNLIVNGGLRKEYYEGINPSPQYSIGIRYQINNRFIIRTDIASKFRKPTFNEKYWRPGGNPRLNPEKGRGAELTMEWKVCNNENLPLHINAQISGFYQTVDNWIQWTMLDSLTPVEYKKVHAMGVETGIHFDFTEGNIKVKGRLQYNLNRSIIVSTRDDNKYISGNQLIYIPEHTFRASVMAEYEGIHTGASVNYTGSRETVETGDEIQELPSFALVDWSIGYHQSFHDCNMVFALSIDNIFNKRYEVIRSYPMPGRTLHFTLTLGLNKTRSEN